MKLITTIPLQICAKTQNRLDLFANVGLAMTSSFNTWVIPPQTICASEAMMLEFMDALEDATCQRFQISACHVFADSEVCLSFSGLRNSRNEKRDFYKSL